MRRSPGCWPAWAAPWTSLDGLVDPTYVRDPGLVTGTGAVLFQMAKPARMTEPGQVVVLDGNPRTRATLKSAGCEVHGYAGSEISLKGDGGPTCLTAPIWRDDSTS
jgi:arginine deiminase